VTRGFLADSDNISLSSRRHIKHVLRVYCQEWFLRLTTLISGQSRTFHGGPGNMRGCFCPQGLMYVPRTPKEWPLPFVLAIGVSELPATSFYASDYVNIDPRILSISSAFWDSQLTSFPTAWCALVRWTCWNCTFFLFLVHAANTLPWRRGKRCTLL
jgi:hypothetical protein